MFKIQLLLNRVISKLNVFYKSIYYVGGTDVLPPPLSKEEEEKLVSELAAGNDKTKSILIERNLRLVVYIARKFENTGVGVEDLVSVGTIGLIKAVNTFNPDKKIKLATYASRCIENEILMLFRNNKKQKSEVYLQDPIGVDKEGNEFCLMDILSSEKDCVLDKVESNLQVKALYKKLSESLTRRESSILIMRYGLIDGKCKTQREIAKDLGISRSYVSRIEKKALKKLKKELYSKA